ncbi:hypothetical protein [Emticicia oligotrophica]|uniref:hypothetical protein n=1 Tax=Emticicia oligotrophica TaxID=312279 RepID=UPI00273B3860|nr:hypothetical protein [Emticicia oligotrophica]
MTKRLPTEFAINMCLDKMMILQQTELNEVSQLNYFDNNSPCHLYFIGKRPRVIVDKDSFKVKEEYIEMNFKIQKENDFENLPLKFENNLKGPKIDFKTSYPYNTFQILDNDELVMSAKVSPFLQSILHYPHKKDFLDFEVLYIGQSYGVEGARTAPDRLVSHSTLQGIYAEALSNNPDSEIWLALASFSQINLIMFDGRTKFTEEEKDADKERFKSVYDKLNWEGINEQQKINFTEAALIKYFQPPYNKIYKDSFPNPAHSTYSECYDLDVNSVCIELNTSENVNCQFFSSTIKKAPWHMKDFLLHSNEDRRSMFEIT